MALRAKKPEFKQERFKVLLYSEPGVGKTHFCCSFPDSYYIDTENLEDNKHFVEMLRANNSDHIRLNELSDIIKEVKELLSTKHNYKTLIIDSLSFPNGALAALEAERLHNKTPSNEGTEFGANVAKGKRLTFQLGILLSRLDMNVIVTSHQKAKFLKSEQIGDTYDINDKMEYALGSAFQMKLMGSSRRAFIAKSRNPGFVKGTTIDFENGYEIVKNVYGEEVFKRESTAEVLATSEQLSSLNHLIQTLKYPEEETQKWLIKAGAQSFDEMNTALIQRCIDFLKEKLLQPKAA